MGLALGGATILVVAAVALVLTWDDKSEPRQPADGARNGPQVLLSTDEVDDGERITVDGSGFGAGVEVFVLQCRAGSHDCDGGRRALTRTDGAGTFRLEMRVFTEIFGYEGWHRCEPCAVVASAGPTEIADEQPITVVERGTPIRPLVSIAPSGPYSPEQRVTLTGTGFQTSAGTVTIGWCLFNSDDPASEISGDPARGYAECLFPGSTFVDFHTPHNGTFTTEFPMPPDSFAERCAAGGARCGLADHPGEAMPPLFVTMFDIAL